MVMESRKRVLINIFAGQNRDDIENELVHTMGEGEGGTNWERSTTYIHYHM